MAKNTNKASDDATKNKAASSANAGQAGAQAPAGVATGPADPAPATTFDDPSGAIMEPAIREAVPMDHPAVDANPRAGTPAEANTIDFNLPAGVQPIDDSAVGDGLDPVPYGKNPASTK